MHSSLLELIKSRRSIRKWKSTKISQEIIQKIIQAASSAPSSHNSNPWEFIVVNDTNIVKTLLSDRLQMKDEPYYINSKKWAKENGLDKYQEVSLPPLLIIVCGDTKKLSDKIALTASVSCAAENILLAAHALGLGACYLFASDDTMPEVEHVIRQTLKIPSYVFPSALIAIGYADQAEVKEKQYTMTRVHTNTW